MKAVLWTDTLQLLIMFAGIFTVFIAGVIHEGGFTEITSVSRKSGRLDVLEYVDTCYFDHYKLLNITILLFMFSRNLDCVEEYPTMQFSGIANCQ